MEISKTFRIFGEDVKFRGDHITGMAIIRYKNRDVILQYICGDQGDVIFINRKRIDASPSAITYESLIVALVDEIIGVALGVNFCVKHKEHSWYYYAEIEQPWQIESKTYLNSVTPSYEHWKDWIISSIEHRKRDDQNTYNHPHL